MNSMQLENIVKVQKEITEIIIHVHVYNMMITYIGRTKQCNLYKLQQDKVKGSTKQFKLKYAKYK